MVVDLFAVGTAVEVERLVFVFDFNGDVAVVVGDGLIEDEFLYV